MITIVVGHSDPRSNLGRHRTIDPMSWAFNVRVLKFEMIFEHDLIHSY